MKMLELYYTEVVRIIRNTYKQYIRGLLTASEAKQITKEVGSEMYSDLKLDNEKLSILLNLNIREEKVTEDKLITDCIIQLYMNNVYGIAKQGAEISALISYALYLATDKLNTMNVPKINTNVVPQVEADAHRVYLKERERLHPGMADVSNIYYNLPVEDRKTFRNANPKLTAYMEWNTQYKK